MSADWETSLPDSPAFVCRATSCATVLGLSIASLGGISSTTDRIRVASLIGGSCSCSCKGFCAGCRRSSGTKSSIFDRV